MDLNSLIYVMERTIAADCRALADTACARDYAGQAARRRAAILGHMWTGAFFADYDLDRRAPSTELTAAAAFPLFAHLATPTQATAFPRCPRPGPRSSGPAACRPPSCAEKRPTMGRAQRLGCSLQWIAVSGLAALRREGLANRIASALAGRGSRARVPSQGGRILEKYVIVVEARPGGGGEYPTQDGFGWTNGVTLELLSSRQRPAE